MSFQTDIMEEVEIYEFGDFRLDTKKKLLLRGDESLSITKKMYDVLLLLIENADRVVGKQELMERVWHDRFVEENNLTYNIRMLRQAIGDNASDPRFIETVPRHGYRFIADVTSRTADASGKDAVEKVPNRRLVARRSLLIAAPAFALLVLSLGLAAVYGPGALFKSNPRLFGDGFRSVMISDTGKAYQSALSPDGRYIAYTNVVNGKESLWLQHLETANNTVIVPPADDVYAGVTFSRSGNSIYFVRRKRTDLTATIYRIPASGGVPTKVVDDAEGWISISPDDRLIAFVRGVSRDEISNRLMTIRTDGTDERTISAGSFPDYYWAQSFSPDGKKIAVVHGNSASGSRNMGLVEIDLASGERRDLMAEKFFHIKDVEWLPDSRRLIFSADMNVGEPVRIWELDGRDGTVEKMTDDLTNHGGLSLSADAASLVATTVTPDFQILVRDIRGPGHFVTLTQARDRFGFTPEGKIVYASDAAGNEDIWIMDIDGSNQRQLTNYRGIDLDPVVSPDGEFVFFSSNRSGTNAIWRMKIDGSDPVQLTKNGCGYSRFVTPDGKHLLYEAACSRTLMKIAVDGSSEEVFSEGGWPEQVFSPDGRLIAFIKSGTANERDRIVILDAESRSAVKSFEVSVPSSRAYHLRWKDNSNVAYLLKEQSSRAVWAQSLDGSEPQMICEVEGDGIADLKFSPDGTRVAIIRGGWRHDAVLLKAE